MPIIVTFQSYAGVKRLIFLTFLTACAHQVAAPQKPPSAVDEAIAKAQILPSDSLELKIEKTLRLINQEHYYDPKKPVGDLPPPFDQRYHLDSLRTPEQILAQKVGGYCGSAALVFTAMLRKSGVKNENLRIVLAVNSPDLKMICPVAGQTRTAHPRTGASGHVFVAVKFSGGEWRLINTVDGTNYESVAWIPPETLAERMAKAPVQIPFSIYKRFPPELRSQPMVVFVTWRPDEVPLHTFDQRLDLIASGLMGDAGDFDRVKICRYGAREMARLKKHGF